ncbi:MAG: FecR family protein [Polyangiaceae bacterium]|nr:FecR family protein [Polyangiaceae bacterium]
MKGALDKWIEEAREDLGKRPSPDVDWEAVDAKLFARIEELKRAERARFVVGPRRAWFATAAAAAGALAVVALAFGRPTERASLAVSADAGGSETIGVLNEVSSSAHVYVRGALVDRGAAIATGDDIFVRDGDAFFESPGRVRLVIESGSRVRVTRRRGPLVVALDEGALEADVTPVARGEAFAVDTDNSRIAVHGTHFRVARTRTRALVDLSEGVVAVGEAPRAGALIGTVVSAPAHVEFAVAGAAGSLSVTHDPGAVRPPAPWPDASAEPPAPLLEPAAATPERASAPSQAHFGVATTKLAEPHPAAPLPSVLPSPPLPPPPAATASSSPPAPANPVPPEVALATAVRDCMSERPRADNVTVLFQTTLELEVGDDGLVRVARFNPPVLPDVNACAAPTIYRVRFPHAGPVSIPIDFKN